MNKPNANANANKRLKPASPPAAQNVPKPKICPPAPSLAIDPELLVVPKAPVVLLLLLVLLPSPHLLALLAHLVPVEMHLRHQAVSHCVFNLVVVVPLRNRHGEIVRPRDRLLARETMPTVALRLIVLPPQVVAPCHLVVGLDHPQAKACTVVALEEVVHLLEQLRANDKDSEVLVLVLVMVSQREILRLCRRRVTLRMGSIGLELLGDCGRSKRRETNLVTMVMCL
jgi:hypothetical protein